MSTETADVLDDAADLIEAKGWVQGVYCAPEGVCALGALEVVSGLSAVEIVDMPPANALRKVIGHPFIAFWNDATLTTQRRVLDAFRLAAKNERAEAEA